ncbi:MAG: bifunctional phosphopantothenoylcysteine decarboxylase/phosphopantothenate--cysteine ligase CoaBC [Anaerolineae bacterium]|nr:MAG: bifunctional phosphopantothenoylcysteine decarboxylase/phosphopantothenate--cysteine ligase CoaBC [Anaerolineae bacterium]
MQGKRILLGITGSIACYKSIDLASKLTQAGAAVDVILTESAMKFIEPLSLSSVTGRPAYWDMWGLEDHILHVKLAESADLIIIAPATAHTIAKLAHGLADNLLTVSILAARTSLILAPAMDAGMYKHPATSENISILRKRGVIFAGPTVGRMASGMTGPGRMLEVADLLDHIRHALSKSGSLKGNKIVVTAGPTEEPIDPIRFLTNRSSGRQGFALAQAALDAGAEVTLISGPAAQKIPFGLELIRVRTAVEMHEAVLNAIKDCDVLLMAAAVSDFRPEDIQKEKMKKDGLKGSGLSLNLVRNPDILADVRKLGQESGERPTVVLGFAAETTDIMVHGEKKLVQKGLDFIVINDVSAPGSGFATDTNKVVILGLDGRKWDLPLQEKSQVAEKVISIVSEELLKKNKAAD